MRRIAWLFLMGLGLTCALCPPACADVDDLQLVNANVVWTGHNRVTACPAGDSVLAGYPCRLRMVVTYTDGTSPRVGVPPESIWVDLLSTGTGNVKLNDRVRVFADDSTDGNGVARFNIGGLSGAGNIALRLTVSGDTVGTQSFSIRTTDTNADGKVDFNDQPGRAHLDYDAVNDPAGKAADSLLIVGHYTHSHRNLLFGTPVMRTSLCGTCSPDAPGTLGDSEISWAPGGKRIAHTQFVLNPSDPTHGDCHLFLLNANPADGNSATELTSPGATIHDYDPEWSPLGTEIVFTRHDNTIMRKGIAVPGVSSNTSESIFYSPRGPDAHRAAETPALSPSADWIAYSVIDLSGVTGGSNLWVVPASGDTTQRKQLTTGSPVDFYPTWSSDAKWIYFDRTDSGTTHEICRVRADTTSLPGVEVLHGSTTGASQSVLPSVTPDGVAVLFGTGAGTLSLVTQLASATAPPVITNYPEHTLNFSPDAPGDTAKDYILTPRLSADGTRTAFRARPPGHPGELAQLWAVRRNMYAPPIISSLTGYTVNHDAPYHDYAFAVGATSTITVSASSPSGEALTYQAYNLTDSGMSFNATTHKLSWNPSSAAAGKTYNVRFQVMTPSGGTDYAIARIYVSEGGGGGDDPPILDGAVNVNGKGPLVQTIRGGMFFLDVTLAPGQENMALNVYDVRGRRVRNVGAGAFGAGKHRFTWRLDDQRGSHVGAGVYFAQLRAGGKQRVKRLIVLP